MGVVENSKMPRAFSSDLCWRILWLYHYKELNYTTIANLLYVHVSTVSRVISRYNASADVAPITDYRHGPTRILRHPKVYGVIVDAVIANPSLYLYELRQHLYQSTKYFNHISSTKTPGFYTQKITTHLD